MIASSKTRELLIAIAKLYYIGNMNQNEIAALTGLSRPKISRLLKEARSKKIVQFTVATPEAHYKNLESKIRETFSLKQVIVTPTEISDDRTRVNVCQAAAEYLSHTIKDGDITGLAWGSTTSGLIKYIPHVKRTGLKVYQLCAGMTNRNVVLDGHETTKMLAESLGAEYHILNAPYVVNSGLMKNLLLQEPEIARHYRMFEKMNVAIVGMGSSDPAKSMTYLADYITLKEAEDFAGKGLAADIAGYRLHEDGSVADIPLNERIMSIGLETLKKIPHVIAVAFGEDKSASIIAAARGGYYNALITDEIAAIAICKKLNI